MLAVGLLLMAGLMSIGGCGEGDRGPKTELSADEKQQIIELNEQRKDEWGNTVK
jgi:hypothetical protein